MFKLLSIFLTLCLVPIFATANEHHDNDNSKVFLTSFPGSGSHWLMYVIQHLSGHVWHTPTKDLIFNKDLPLDSGKYFRGHKVNNRQFYNNGDSRRFTYDSTKDKLILLIRNYKELYFRDQLLKKEVHEYFNLLERYDHWPQKNRALIYYESLISNFDHTIHFLCDFLNCNPQHAYEFLESYEQHAKISRNIYKGIMRFNGKSKQNTLFYSDRLSPAQQNKIDRTFEKLYPKLYKKYLVKYKNNTHD